MVNSSAPHSLISPPLIGHRGLAGIAPENTLLGFKTAKEHGINWVEFDIFRCHSGEWVVFHDDDLERTSNGQGAIQELSLEELKKLDVGSWFDKHNPRFQDLKIPLLSETLTYLQQIQLHANIELKGHYHNVKESIQQFLQDVEQHWPKHLPPPLISSFDISLLLELKKMSSSLPIGLIIEEWQADSLRIVHQEGFSSLICDYQNLEISHVTQANQLGIPLLAYTVNDRDDIQHLFEIGVNAVFTDYPIQV